MPTEIIGNSITTEFIEWNYFPSAVHYFKAPEFLDITKEVVDEYLTKAKLINPLDEINPMYMTDNLQDDSRMKELGDYVKQKTWNILKNQGHNMSIFDMVFYDFWGQELFKYASQEQHTHPGCQITGFYFLECPEPRSKIVFHDPRPGRIAANLSELDPNKVSYSSTSIFFVPEPGKMMFTNAWLPHTIAKVSSETPFKFIHFNLGVVQKTTTSSSNAEII
jgi:uncharacterized protein (TIGR02466 family)